MCLYTCCNDIRAYVHIMLQEDVVNTIMPVYHNLMYTTTSHHAIHNQIMLCTTKSCYTQPHHPIHRLT